MRAIDGDALIKKAYDEAKGMAEPYDDFGVLVEWLVGKSPTIEPERRKGKWMPDNTNYYEERYICLECGRSYKVDMCMDKPMWNFCPNCGADMRKEQK